MNGMPQQGAIPPQPGMMDQIRAKLAALRGMAPTPQQPTPQQPTPQQPTPPPEMLGTGAAARAGTALQGRSEALRRAMEAQGVQ
jgi:hypothetical protein